MKSYSTRNIAKHTVCRNLHSVKLREMATFCDYVEHLIEESNIYFSHRRSS